MNNSPQSRAALPLVEMTIAIGVLAVCSVITVSLFLNSHFASKASSDMNMALMIAQTQIEELKAQNAPEGYIVLYDRQWQITDSEPLFLLTVTLEEKRGPQGAYEYGNLSIKRTAPYPFLKKQRQEILSIDLGHFRQGAQGL